MTRLLIFTGMLGLVVAAVISIGVLRQPDVGPIVRDASVHEHEDEPTVEPEVQVESCWNAWPAAEWEEEAARCADLEGVPDTLTWDEFLALETGIEVQALFSRVEPPFRLVAFRPYVNLGPGPLTEEQLTYMDWMAGLDMPGQYFTDMAEVLGRCYDSNSVGLAITGVGPVTEDALMAECEEPVSELAPAVPPAYAHEPPQVAPSASEGVVGGSFAALSLPSNMTIVVGWSLRWRFLVLARSE